MYNPSNAIAFKTFFSHLEAEVSISKKVSLQKQPLELFYKKGVLKNFAKLTEKQLLQGLFFNTVASLRAAT